MWLRVVYWIWGIQACRLGGIRRWPPNAFRSGVAGLLDRGWNVGGLMPEPMSAATIVVEGAGIELIEEAVGGGPVSSRNGRGAQRPAMSAGGAGSVRVENLDHAKATRVRGPCCSMGQLGAAPGRPRLRMALARRRKIFARASGSGVPQRCLREGRRPDIALKLVSCWHDPWLRRGCRAGARAPDRRLLGGWATKTSDFPERVKSCPADAPIAAPVCPVAG